VFQTCLNVFGSVDLLPLTGVTCPFVSNGGSAMMSAWGLLAFLKATDTRENASFAIRRGPAKRLTKEARRRADARPHAPRRRGAGALHRRAGDGLRAVLVDRRHCEHTVAIASGAKQSSSATV